MLVMEEGQYELRDYSQLGNGNHPTAASDAKSCLNNFSRGNSCGIVVLVRIEKPPL